MTNQERELLRRNYTKLWGGWIFKWLSLEETQALTGQIPPAWVDLVANPCAAQIQNVWAKAAESLPRFLDYLTHSILEARVVESSLGYLLVYFLKDWRELGPYEYEDGFMMSGLPTAAHDIQMLEAQVGSLPTSLRTLWLTHGFLQRRDGTFTTSLQAQQQKLAHAPTFYPARKDSWEKGRVLDCLGIADVIGEIVPSLSRQMGALIWEDYIMNVMRWRDTMSKSLHMHLDNFLTDWTFSNWPKGD